ncbi:hypothetical protein CC1G_04290 [Coprinopsis cinerea okayama7|uniref:Ribosome biogenesis protein NSA1 n=1 Tax=Coprinopsis cinerea (strain Okayama-7 / 130 / ATCC MYA-4618 / FGSC 9003) TaxID=240176 RepID=A8NFK8_COPC7|nr:hypothetical protein CC1G_04290 [Coprinopsis cinerea okayama7\|eukprot:XP_001833311.2 hypothetical protein CC1G_04290 [Coprinopsis cinerea okayama7\
MARFLVGDDLGSLKIFKYSNEAGPSGSKVEVKSVYRSEASFRGEARIGVQGLATLNTGDGVLAATAFSDGNLQLSRLQDDDTLETVCSWTEPKLKANRFVGVALTDRAVFSCTGNGALRRAAYSHLSTEAPVQTTRGLPMRLCDWKLSPNGEHFAYGGEEVALSVWDTEKAFQETSPQPESLNASSKKRKRNDVLFPGETWRAKNLSNDSLSLRQPIRITALDFIQKPNTSLAVGNQAGDVQRYDTRSGRRPVAEWKSIGKSGGIRTLASGVNENELFVSDNGTNLYSVDLRTGKILYGYHGIAASVSCISTSSGPLLSGALDQYVRVHSVTPPPKDVKQRLDNRGITLERHFFQSTPTVITWDKRPWSSTSSGVEQVEEEDDDDPDHDIWDDLETAQDEDEDADNKGKRRRTSSKKT